MEVGSHLGGYVHGNPGDPGDEGTFSVNVWEYMIENYGVKSVLDIGCGEGHALYWFVNRGLRAIGVEGHPQAIVDSPVPGRIVQHDYTLGPYTTPERYDMVWCAEFVEHVEEKFIPNFVASFRMADHALITHALPGRDWEGYHHVNCQNADYWISVLKDAGYSYDAELTTHLRSIAEPHASYVRRNLLCFHKQG